MKEYFRQMIRYTICDGVRNGDVESAVKDIIAVLLHLNPATRDEMAQVMFRELSVQGVSLQETERIIAKAMEDVKDWLEACGISDGAMPEPKTEDYCFRPVTQQSRPEIREAK